MRDDLRPVGRINGKHIWYIRYSDGCWFMTVELGRFSVTVERGINYRKKK